MINWKTFKSVKVREELEAQWTADSTVLGEMLETGGAEGVSAVDENTGDSISKIVVDFAENAGFEVEEFFNEIVDFVPVLAGGVG